MGGLGWGFKVTTSSSMVDVLIRDVEVASIRGYCVRRAPVNVVKTRWIA